MKAFTSTAVAACLALTACNKSAEQSADELGAKADNIAETAGARIDQAADAAENRIDNSMERVGAAITPTPTPQEFIDAAAKSDAFEIAAAKLAGTKAASPEVRSFAQQMIKAHTDSTAKIKAASGKLVPNAALTKDQSEDLAELGKLSGAKFDDEYMDGQVEAHESALALMNAFSSDGADASLKAAATEIAPVVQGHLTMARDLEKKTDQ
jgi:putative membrane protein